jgi:pentapeptide MXKDX repeat protein
MNKIFTAAALTALVSLTGTAFAQDAVKTAEMDGKKVAMVSADAPRSDKMKAAWAFYNADAREVRRFRAKGFSESDFKAIANIALRSGLSTDYVARQVKDAGYPLRFVAAWAGVPTDTLDDDIPGFGADLGIIETK